MLSKTLRGLSLLLVIVGALNWGLWGLFQVDLVAVVFKGSASLYSRITYVTIGAAGVFALCGLKKCCSSKSSQNSCCGSNHNND
ncbi:DUF378 domain-containing protein [Candidatus Clavichlamydia salmonicola]|uniref:DUF378 domain-containing protein n=1 Tax=Candidatus Clavichlamydia salmonicola TaxID=469812 RepID=UPI001E3ED66E|nr:DUF378 domain-containing protein [Candidatus Clavichlamydia salmonicola]